MRGKKETQGIQHRVSQESGDRQAELDQAVRDSSSQQAAASASFNRCGGADLRFYRVFCCLLASSRESSQMRGGIFKGHFVPHLDEALCFVERAPPRKLTADPGTRKPRGYDPHRPQAAPLTPSPSVAVFFGGGFKVSAEPPGQESPESSCLMVVPTDPFRCMFIGRTVTKSDLRKSLLIQRACRSFRIDG